MLGIEIFFFFFATCCDGGCALHERDLSSCCMKPTSCLPKFGFEFVTLLIVEKKEKFDYVECSKVL